jgi:hypothetical protein
LGYDIFTLGRLLDKIEKDYFSLVILDAWYRFLPENTSENNNAQVMALYNRIDAYTGRLGAAWVNIHHPSKGNQSEKNVTDVGSGAGSQARAADTHLILRENETKDVATLDAVVRSWVPVDRCCVRWNFPLWELDLEADPEKLAKTTHSQFSADRTLAALVDGMTSAEWQAAAGMASDNTLRRYRNILVSLGKVHEANKHWWKTPQ